MATKKIQLLGSFSDNIAVDTTLKESGKAADAKVTGEKIDKLQSTIDEKVIEINDFIEDITNGSVVVNKAESATTATSADTATSAVQDGSGYTITDTYETKKDAGDKLDAAKSYADDIKKELLNNAGEAYDTLQELGVLISTNSAAINSLNNTVAEKADAQHNHEGLYYNKNEINNMLAPMQYSIDEHTEAIADISKDYLTSENQTALKDGINEISSIASGNAEAIKILNGDNNINGSVKNSIDIALTEFTTNVVDGISGHIAKVEEDFSEYKETISNQFTNFSNTVTSIDGAVDSVISNFTQYQNDTNAQLAAIIADQQTIYESLDEKAATEHQHDIEDIKDLQDLISHFDDHIENKENPHSVTADQVGTYTKDQIQNIITVDDIIDICQSSFVSSENIDLVNMASKYWVEQYYQPKGSYLTAADITIHNTATDSHNDIRLEIKDLKDVFETFLECDDETIKQIQDIVDYVNENDSIITGITTKKVNISDIINNLTTNVSDKPLSAAQGVVLNNLISELKDKVDGQTVKTDDTLSTEFMAADAKAVGEALAGKASVSDIDEATTIDAALTVQLGANGTIGGYKTGDVIAEGTSVVTIINKLLQKTVPATYTKPKVTLSAQSTAAGSYEYGTNITAQVKATFTKNDAGAIQSIAILKDGVEILNGASSTLVSSAEGFQLTSSVSYTASATYAEGPIKNNNLGEASPNGHIEAGTVTSSAVTFTPYRQGYFYGVLATDNTTPLTSDIIRSCHKKGGAYAAGNLPLISASSVDKRKRIFVACPATNTGITKVVMPSAQGSDATKDFVKQSSTVIVEGANGSDGIAYNVWVYEPDLISDDQTFTVTLG